MNFNVELRELVLQKWVQYGKPSDDEFQNLKANSGGVAYHSFKGKANIS